MDLGINDMNASYSTELASSGSWIVKSPDLGRTWNVLEETNDGVMDIGASSFDNMTGVVSSVLGRVVYTVDGGKTWLTAIEPLFGSQSISRSRDGSKVYCAAGSNKVSISNDKGFTWDHHTITGLNNGSRYCALPTSKVWYATAGFWVEDDDNKNHMHLTSKLTIDKQTGDVLFKNHKRAKIKRRRMQDEFMWAEIWKTSDGGNTWTRQYADDNRFYFNAIDCCDETHCIAVAEGDAESGSNESGTRIFMTSDGTNWQQMYYDNEDASSLMAAHCISDMEAYAGGGDIEGGRGFGGYFLHTTDGGKTWSNTTVKAPVMFMDMTDDGKYGVG
eukprot:67049_1